MSMNSASPTAMTQELYTYTVRPQFYSTSNKNNNL